MILVAEMESGGVFEAATKRELVDQMAKHYAENNCEVGQIKAIFISRGGLQDFWTTDESTPEIVSRVQALVEEAVAEWQKVSCQQSEENKELQSDYYAGVL